MTTQRLMMAMGLVAMMGAGCGQVGPSGTDGQFQDIRTCPYKNCAGTDGDEPNGRGIHIATTKTPSTYGIHDSEIDWWVTHFQQVGPDVRAVGWSKDGLGTLVQVAGSPITASFHGKTYKLAKLQTNNSMLIVSLLDTVTMTTLQLANSDVDGLILGFEVTPAYPVRSQPKSIYLFFNSSEEMKSNGTSMFGYRLQYLIKGAASKVDFCLNSDGTDEWNVFHTGSSFDPLTGVGTSGANLTNITCRTGAVAVCMQWGYQPWASAFNKNSQQLEPLEKYHQACIHMKRAAYIQADLTRTFTLEGTEIQINDPFDPPFNSSSMVTTEAYWVPQGATCVSDRRHPELIDAVTETQLPHKCDGSDQWLLQSALP